VNLLKVENVDTAYGAVTVNHNVSLSVGEGEIATILGPNGAGKSTLMRAICGLLKPKRGRIILAGQDVTGLPPDRLAKLGIVMVPEGRRIFADLTVRENLRLGAYARADQAEVEADIGRMETYFSILAKKRTAKGGELSGGQQQMLAIARGLMARPRVLLLDEPSLGLSPLMVKEVQSVITDLRKNFGAAVLLVEQNAGLALAVAERGYLMQSGKIVVASAIADLRDSSLMRELYLGGGKRQPTSGGDAAAH
jgi:branched-chain amino acid transport system ATP-binding protein